MRRSNIFQTIMIIIGLFLDSSSAKRIPTFAGPYTITIRTIGNESEEYKSTGKFWPRLYLTPPRPKELQYTWGYVYANLQIHDNLKVEVRISQRSNNEWKKNAFVLKFDRACEAMLFHARCIVNLVYQPHERKCPLPAIGLRKIPNETFDPVFPQFPILPYARYLFTMAFIRGDQVDGIVVADGNAVPKL